MKEFSNIWELRKWLGTNPSDNMEENTKFYRGVEGIYVDLVDWSHNPYKAMFSIATATWGTTWNIKKWNSVSPEARLFVVLAVLNRKCLPNAMEAPSFTFEIAGPSRSAFDQIARARIGAVFGSMGLRDNNQANIGIRIPEYIWRNDEFRNKFIEEALRAKSTYVQYIKAGKGNWQDARAILPMGITHRWTMAMNYMALTGFMSKRLMFSEQADTVATAWLIREKIKEKFPLLSSYLRPASDWAKKCVEHVGDEMAQAFGNLFQCSGRWPCNLTSDKYSFNTACSDRETIMSQLGIYIPKGNEDMPDPNMLFDYLDSKDRELFSAK